MMRISKPAPYILAVSALLYFAPRAEAICFGGTPNGTIDFINPASNEMEACDDGNTDNNDGCTAQCTVETGFSCELAFQGTSFQNEDFSTATSTVKPSWTHHADGFGSTQATNTAQPSVGLFGIQALDLGEDTPFVFEISTSTEDDDFIGFVIGYNPGDGTTPANNPNYFIFDWKGANQQFTSPNWVSYAGTRLLWVQGVPDNTKDQEQHEFWRGNGVASVVWSNLNTAADSNDARRWIGNHRYRFFVTYTTTSLKIEVERYANAAATVPDQARRTLLDVTPSGLPNYTAGTFPSGQLGLYTLSQPSTSFRFIGPRSSVCDAVCGDGILISGAEECDGAVDCNQTTCKFSVDIHDEAAGAPDRFPEAITFTGSASPGAVVTMSVAGPHGSISIPLGDRDITAGPDGTFTWTSPALSAIGVYTITASATDIAGGVTTDSTTREIVDPLILLSDSLSVLGGSSASVNILNNDWVHANTPITVTRIDTTSVPGTHSLDANGLYTFTSTSSSASTFSVDYEVCVAISSSNYCKSAQIQVNVIEPISFDDASVWQRVGVSSATLDLSTVYRGSAPLNLGSITFPALSVGGTTTSSGDGVITFTPNNPTVSNTFTVEYRACASTTPAACADGEITFFWNDDPRVQSAAVSVAPESVTTHNVSIVPRALGTIESTAVTGAGCALADSILTFTAPATIPLGGTVSCTITATEFFPETNQPTSDGVWVFTITNDFVATSDSFETYENTELEILVSDLLANDANADATSLTIVGTPDTEGAYPTENGGSIAPNNSSDGWVYIPPADYVGTDSFEYTVCSIRDAAVCSIQSVTITVVEAPSINDSTRWVVVGTPSVTLDLDALYQGEYPLDHGSIAEKSINGAATLAVNSSILTITPDDINAPGVYEIEIDYCDANAPAGCATMLVTVVYNDHPTVSNFTYNLKPNSTHSVPVATLLADRSQEEIEGGWDETSIAVSALEGGPFGTTATASNGATCTLNGSSFVATSAAREGSATCFIRFCEANPGPAGIDATDRACVVQKITIVVDPNVEEPGPEPEEPTDPWDDLDGATLSGGRVFGACNQGGSSAGLALALLAIVALAYRNRRRLA